MNIYIIQVIKMIRNRMTNGGRNNRFSMDSEPMILKLDANFEG